MKWWWGVVQQPDIWPALSGTETQSVNEKVEIVAVAGELPVVSRTLVTRIVLASDDVKVSAIPRMLGFQDN